MHRIALLTAISMLLISGCTSEEKEVPQAVAVAMSVPAQEADREILIASRPSEAQVLLKDAVVGTTPMKMLIRDDTNVVLKKDGYVRQAVMITRNSDPNMVIELVSDGSDTESEEAEEPASEKKAAASAWTKKKKSADRSLRNCNWLRLLRKQPTLLKASFWPI